MLVGVAVALTSLTINSAANTTPIAMARRGELVLLGLGTVSAVIYISAILLDEGSVVEPAAQLRPYYPNILQTLREKKRELVHASAGRAHSKLDDPMGVISEFVEFVRGEKPNEAETGVVTKIVDQPVREEV